MASLEHAQRHHESASRRGNPPLFNPFLLSQLIGLPQNEEILHQPSASNIYIYILTMYLSTHPCVFVHPPTHLTIYLSFVSDASLPCVVLEYGLTASVLESSGHYLLTELHPGHIISEVVKFLLFIQSQWFEDSCNCPISNLPNTLPMKLITSTKIICLCHY